ncbi:MAG TPA: hypothetical protein VE575_04140 [Acidimicrobiales bacterium]|nr:hypothetical protein [Acidimicrobiales bacterium]
MLRSIEAEARPARPDEQAVLARWSGWGATPAVFADDHADDLDDVRQRLRALLSPEEWDGARRTVLNAHYTDPTVVAAIWDAAARLGFDGGRALEPGCGSFRSLCMSHRAECLILRGSPACRCRHACGNALRRGEGGTCS